MMSLLAALRHPVPGSEPAAVASVSVWVWYRQGRGVPPLEVGGWASAGVRYETQGGPPGVGHARGNSSLCPPSSWTELKIGSAQM